MTAVSVRDAFRIYGEGTRAVVALQGLTLDVEPGEIVVVLGPSGSGKTTLLRVVAGLERLSAGSVRTQGIDIGRLERRSSLLTTRASSDSSTSTTRVRSRPSCRSATPSASS